MTSEHEERDAMDLDRILVEEVGQFGPYQLRNLMLAAVIGIFTAFGASEYVFTTARVPSRCLIPECDGPEPQFSTGWEHVALPYTGAGFDQCNRFAGVNLTEPETRDDTCPAELFDRSLVLPCEEYVYRDRNSVVYDYDLACKEWLRSLIGSLRTLGTLTALPITGYVSDRWGRRTALTINSFNTAWLGLVRYWANTYVGFVVLEFAEATFGSGLFSCAYILVTELTGPRWRVVAGASINTFFSTGQVLLGLIAWGVPQWRNLTLVLYAPMLLTLAYFWVIAESVRWLMSKGRFEESERVLKTAARVNGGRLSDKSLEALRASEAREAAARAAGRTTRAPWLPGVVWRSRPLLLRCLAGPVWWVTTTLVYYGLSVNSVNLSGNSYVNFVAVSAVEIPGYWTAVLLLSIVGRRPVLVAAYWLCAACQLAYIFVPAEQYAVTLTLFLVGKFSIAVVMTSVYVYTAELFPTPHRHSLFAFCSMVGRLGSVLAPLTPALGDIVWEHLPAVLFGSFALLSGALVLTTPETLGTKLPETVEEAEQLGRTTHK